MSNFLSNPYVGGHLGIPGKKSSPPSSDSTISEEEEKNGKRTLGGIIAGIIIGSLVLAVIVTAIVCLKRKDAEDKKGMFVFRMRKNGTIGRFLCFEWD